MIRSKFSDNDSGVVLFTTLMFVLIMSILGTIACIITGIDAMIAGNHHVSRVAFYSAEAGVHFALASIEKDLKTHEMALPTADGDVVSLSTLRMTPDPDITDIYFEYLPAGAPILTRIAANTYQFTVRGHSARSADADIRVTFRNRSALKFGAFGDKGFSAPEYSNFYGYDSTLTSTPSGDDGTNQYDIGSNNRVTLSANTEVHGHIGLGSDENSPAVYNPIGNPEPRIYGAGGAVRNLGPITPDPLGIIDGEYAEKMNDCRMDNDNGTIPADLILENNASVTLVGKSGGANYYFSNIELKAGAFLNIDTRSGPVTLFLTGEFDGKNGTIVHTDGDPKNFTLLSNSSASISLSNHSAFFGLVYAPFADLDIFNRAPIYGAILGQTVEIKNSGDFYFDIALKDAYLTAEVAMSSWQEIRR